MAGAAAVQVCKAVYRDIGAGARTVAEIREAMQRCGYQEAAALKGCALGHLPEPPLFTVPGAKLA